MTKNINDQKVNLNINYVACRVIYPSIGATFMMKTQETIQAKSK